LEGEQDLAEDCFPDVEDGKKINVARWKQKKKDKARALIRTRGVEPRPANYFFLPFQR
jgi:hypothetical protein